MIPECAFIQLQDCVLLFFKGIWEHHLTCHYNAPFILIMCIIIFNYFLERILSYFNTRNYTCPIPEEAKDVYEKEQYERSQEYKRTNDQFSFITSTYSFILIITVLTLHIFGYIDQVVRSFTSNPILIALFFFGIIMLVSDLLNTPFALYDTFVIEEKFGFNKTSLKVFFLDKIKGWFLSGFTC
jgi:STE24 endopeptidase